MTVLRLPRADGTLAEHRLGEPGAFRRPEVPITSRTAYAAAHVVADPLAGNDPWISPAIDWETTLKFRHRLWDLGLGVAEAMDTAQRGMGLDWPMALELIRRSVAAWFISGAKY